MSDLQHATWGEGGAVFILLAFAVFFVCALIDGWLWRRRWRREYRITPKYKVGDDYKEIR